MVPPLENIDVERLVMTTETNKAFKVKIASSGELIEVPPDKSIVETLESHGIDITVSCEQGICGTCLTPVLEGTPDHRDEFMTPDEHAANDMMTPCCSRSLSDLLILDL